LPEGSLEGKTANRTLRGMPNFPASAGEVDFGLES